MSVTVTEKAKDILDRLDEVEFEIIEVAGNSNEEVNGKFIIASITESMFSQLYVINSNFISNVCYSFEFEYSGYFDSYQEAKEILEKLIKNLEKA